MGHDLDVIARTGTLDPPEIRRLTAEIHRSTLDRSSALDRPDFRAIRIADLSNLYESYDRMFFDGAIAARLEAMKCPLRFTVSRRMTRTGGKTKVFRTSKTAPPSQLEISVAITLLYHTFDDVERSVSVAGVVCEDRLQALQRIFEHELIHLVELLVWDDSNCSAARFYDISRRFFDHRESTHRLITPRERAKEKFGIQAGDRVSFWLEGARHVGLVDRITKRATVLVPDPNGEAYANGHCYAKFYVPLELLDRVEADAP